MRSSDKLRHARDDIQTQWQAFVFNQVNNSESWLTQSWLVSANHISTSQTSAPLQDPDKVHNAFIRSSRYMACKEIIEELKHAVHDSNYAIALSDAHATLQWTHAHLALGKRLEKAHFLPSARWDETSIGTNAVGLAARLGKPVSIFSAQHYIPTLHDWVCYAAPIRHVNTGQLLGVLDISAPWQSATPLALATVSHYAGLIAQTWSNDANQVALDDSFVLAVCQNKPNSANTWHKRLQEIYLTLSLYPQGLSLEALHAYIYGDTPISLSTLKSEISHLRQHIGKQLLARPYRLEKPLQGALIDAQLVEQYALQGQCSKMMQLYLQPVLPKSQAPAITEYRHYLHQLVVRTLACSYDIEALWQFFMNHEAEYKVLMQLLSCLGPNDGRRHAVLAKLSPL